MFYDLINISNVSLMGILFVKTFTLKSVHIYYTSDDINYEDILLPL